MSEPGERPNLDDELRRLFADDRLDLPVARDAGAAVVAGARRRRRNRVALAAAGGVLAMVAFVSGGVVLTGIGRPDAVSSATGPVLTTTIPPATPTTIAPVTAPRPALAGQAAVLGPFGYDKLMLGMPLKEAMATGLFSEPTPAIVANGCLRYTMLIDQVYVLPVPQASGVGAPTTMPVKGKLDVLVSVRYGVTELDGGPLLHTPEGVGVGMSRQFLIQAYPKVDLPGRAGTTAVQVSENPRAIYVFGLSGNGTVTSFSLRLAKSDCPG